MIEWVIVDDADALARHAAHLLLSTIFRAPETVLGRNPVVECLRAGVPATALHLALGATADERIAEAVQLAADAGISILEVPRNDLDRIAGGALHQGIALQVPAYEYAHPDDLLEAAADGADPALIAALDGVTDPRNLGAIVRSVSAFGGHGVVVPQRRSASMTSKPGSTTAASTPGRPRRSSATSPPPSVP